MYHPFIQISDALSDHPVIENLKDEHFRILFKFLRMLNFSEQIMDNHGVKVKVGKGQILTTYRDLAKKFGVDKGVIERLLSKLQCEGIIGIQDNEGVKKPRQQKTLFSLEEKYMVNKKTETTIAKTETTICNDLPRQNDKVPKKTETQIYTPLPSYSSSISVCDTDATACAHRMGKSSQPPDPPKELHHLHPIHKNGRGRKESKLEKEQVDMFLTWTEEYGFVDEKSFVRSTVLRWLRQYGNDDLGAAFDNMLNENRKMKIFNPPGFMETSMQKGFSKQEQFLKDNRSWILEFIKENHINFIEILKTSCKFKHLTYNEQVNFNLPDFRNIIKNRVSMIKERMEDYRKYG